MQYHALRPISNMKRFFAKNLAPAGRLARGAGALLLFVGAGFSFAVSFWLGAVLAGLGIFVLFEALRGWCVLRACGIKTRV
jgi:hypothetical protein